MVVDWFVLHAVVCMIGLYVCLIEGCYLEQLVCFVWFEFCLLVCG